MWAIIGVGVQIVLLLLQKWFSWNETQKSEAKKILEDSKGAKTASTVTAVFDKLANL